MLSLLLAVLIAPPPARHAKVIDITIPQPVVTFDVQCSSKVTDPEIRIKCYEGFFAAMATWERDAPTRAHFKLVGSGESADFKVFIGPEQIEKTEPSCVGEICWDKLTPRLKGRIYIQTHWPTRAAVKHISLHELGHLLGLADSYDYSSFKRWTDGWGIMGSVDPARLYDHAFPEEIDAVRLHR